MSIDPGAPHWPQVPACHGWLGLDRRGRWRLQGEPVSHRGLLAFLDANYASDENGCWFVQNGPQRVFVTLAATPWVFRRETDRFVSHNGRPAGTIRGLLVDHEGSFYLDAELGCGLLDDRDLATLLAECTNVRGESAGEADFAALLAGQGGVFWRGLAVLLVAADDLPRRFAFVTDPQP